MEYVLETAALTKRYRGQTALSGLDMHVPKSAIYGFVGRNSAGKTTLIRLICGLQEPTSGSYSLYGISGSDPHIGRARRRMGAVVETPSIYLDLSAEENLRLQSRLLGLPSERGIGELLRLVGLGGTGRKKARDFSLGMRQRLGIAVALRGNPDLLVLDEPTNGLDPQGIIEMRELILDLNRQHGITVLISSHILDELSRLATHYGFIDGGRMLRELSAAELESHCRKCQRIETDNVRALVRALDRLGAEYAVADETHADVFTPLPVTQLARCAEAEGCEIRSIRERDESLESQDGTLRNKLIAGHARGRVYAAYLVAAVAGCFAITLAWLLSAAVGVAKLGWFTAPAGTLGLAAALILLLTAAEAAVLTLVALLLPNRAVSAVSSILLMFGLIALGSAINNAPSEPEFASAAVMTVNGFEIGKPLPNPNYVSGALRSVYQFAVDALPTGQSILLANLELARPVLSLCASAALTLHAPAGRQHPL